MPPAPPGRSGQPIGLIAVLVVLVVGVLIGGAVLLLTGGDDGGDETGTSGTTQPSGGQGPDEGGGGDGGTGSETGSDATSLTGTWEGTLLCAEGETGLTLTIDDPGDGTAGANFATHEPGGELDADTTRFSLEGLTSDGLLTLEPRDWIVPEEPGPGDVAYGVEVDLDERSDPETLEGNVIGEGCSTFTVERTSTDPWYAGVWEGTYGCAQGVTGLRMTIEPESDGVVQALYEFYAVPENPDVPSGSYRMEGTYDDQREVSLTGVEWVEQPEGYGMVDLLFIAELGVDPERLYGAVSDDYGDCSVFTLGRPES